MHKKKLHWQVGSDAKTRVNGSLSRDSCVSWRNRFATGATDGICHLFQHELWHSVVAFHSFGVRWQSERGRVRRRFGPDISKLAVPARRNHRGSNLVAGQTCCVTDSQVSNLYAAARHWRICPPERDAIPILRQGERLPLRCTQTHGRQVTDPESLHYERRVKYPGLEVFASSKPDRG